MLIEHLQYFISASEHESMSAAAKELNVTQQTISMAMKKLEEELGCTIFHRTGNGIQLTQEGEYLLPLAQSINLQWQNMKEYTAFKEALRFKTSKMRS